MNNASIKAIRNADGTVDLIGKQGTTWELVMKLKNPDGSPMNLTGYTFRGQIRASYASTDKTADISLTIINAAQGEVLFSVGNTVTSSIPAYRDNIDAAKRATYKGVGVYVYDVEMVAPTGKVMRIMEGKLFGDPEATKDV